MTFPSLPRARRRLVTRCSRRAAPPLGASPKSRSLRDHDLAALGEPRRIHAIEVEALGQDATVVVAAVPPDAVAPGRMPAIHQREDALALYVEQVDRDARGARDGVGDDGRAG